MKADNDVEALFPNMSQVKLARPAHAAIEDWRDLEQDNLIPVDRALLGLDESIADGAPESFLASSLRDAHEPGLDGLD